MSLQSSDISTKSVGIAILIVFKQVASILQIAFVPNGTIPAPEAS